jgi:hypothetical protein
LSAMFPKWTNAIPTVAAVVAVGALTTVVSGFWYWATPKYWEVGYMPKQPGYGFNHQIHAGMLGMDCRYCHTNVETSYEANIPPVSTCYGCHQEGLLNPDFDPGEERVGFVREAYRTDRSIEWRRVHKLPDYVHNFPHHVHVQAGVSCFSCHGQITAMPVVYQAHSLSMSWCLDCHRDVQENPELYLAPPDQVTRLQWVEEEYFANSAAHREEARALFENLRFVPPENCGACHY